MSYQIVQASPQALAATEDKPKASYPFDDVGVGQSFLVPQADVSEAALRMAVSRRNKKADGGTFRVVKHGDPHNVFEVARIA